MYSCPAIREKYENCRDQSKPCSKILGQIFRKEVFHTKKWRNTLPDTFLYGQRDLVEVFEILIAALANEDNSVITIPTTKESKCKSCEMSTFGDETNSTHLKLVVQYDGTFVESFQNAFHETYVNVACPGCKKREVWQHPVIDNRDSDHIFFTVHTPMKHFQDLTTDSEVQIFGHTYRIRAFADYSSTTQGASGHYQTWVRADGKMHCVSDSTVTIDGLTMSTDAATPIQRLEDEMKKKTEDFQKARSQRGKFRALHIQAERKVSGEQREKARLGEELALARARIAALETENARLKAANATLQENYDMLDESVFEMPSSNYRNEVLQSDVVMEVNVYNFDSEPEMADEEEEMEADPFEAAPRPTEMEAPGEDEEIAEGCAKADEEYEDELDPEEVVYGDEHNADKTALARSNDGVRVANIGQRMFVSLAEYCYFIIQDRKGINSRFQGAARTLGQLFVIDLAIRVWEMRMKASTYHRAEFPYVTTTSSLMKT
ncbi:hypothetical protein GCK72_012263 [Caenorhabditis remanei]|uniref:USP domain-containing protein n=1 Tax=Caenorhabditis remanei TaxID=31234 RepID=A0A6A5GMG2_CAERE|nr:hypothetical protein GCK72_012263 [Caenorhabditis remanei]KAF1755813.1 hypothetical protein GCK72_012263 [Caenorhabditis remanei]